jgi:hypothetical protein
MCVITSTTSSHRSQKSKNKQGISDVSCQLLGSKVQRSKVQRLDKKLKISNLKGSGEMTDINRGVGQLRFLNL